MEGLYFHCNLSVCLSGSVCEQNSSRTDKPIAYRTGLNPGYWNYWPWVKGQGHSDVIPIFLHNSLLTSLLYFVSHLSHVWSKWNSVCHLTIPLVDLCLNLIKIEWAMTSLWRHLSFLQTIVHISNSIDSTNWNYGQGRTSRSKVTDVEVSAFSECFLLWNIVVASHPWISRLHCGEKLNVAFCDCDE